MLSFRIIIILLVLQQINCWSSCPPPNIDITPCKCMDGSHDSPSAILCFGDQPIDLVNIFEILDANIGPENKTFNIFYLNNTFIQEIPENAFKDFKFQEIYFDKTSNLRKIDPKSLGKSNKTAQYLHVWDTGLNITAGNVDNIKFFDCIKNLNYLDFSTSECPPESLLGTVCKCQKVVEFQLGVNHKSPVITCKQFSNSEELVQIFQNLGKNLKHNKRNFLRFELQDSHISELPEDLFNGITFSEISIQDCPKLSLIDKNVFKSIQPFVNRLFISDINLHNNIQQSEDLWHAISSLNNLVTLNLFNVFNEIPSKAFKIIDSQTQWRLKYFTHSGSSKGRRIKTIGSYAFFNLPNIEIINLQSNQLDNIGKYAFANQVRSDKQLSIQLSRNKLTPKSFSCGSLLGSQRPIKLELGKALVGCNRDMNYLEESVFSAFLDREGNELDMGCSFVMECDCKMKWLYESPNFWRNRVKSGSFGDIVIPCLVEGEEEDEEVSLWDLPQDYFYCDQNNKNNLNLIENRTAENDLENFIEDIMSYL